MGYQGGRRYGDNERSQDRDWSDRDRGPGRYRWQRGARSHGYGTRGQYGGSVGYGREPEGYNLEERGFFDRAGDEIRSWFGDHDAELRREYDEYYNRPYGDPRDQSSRLGFASASNSNRYLPNWGHAPYTGERSGFGSEDHGYLNRSFGPAHDYGAIHDAHYYYWRQQRIDELDRDYAEYQRENRERFNHEFGSWRTRRNELRQAISQVHEHMEVVGSDGEHVGVVDKLRGARIILTKSDQDSGGMHHSVPLSWIRSIDAQKVTLEMTAEEAQAAWRTEREQRALFGSSDEDEGSAGADHTTGSSTEKGRYR